MQNLKITIIQPDIIWEDVETNLDKYNFISSGIGETDVIVLPEMFTTGFSMKIDKLKNNL